MSDLTASSRDFNFAPVINGSRLILRTYDEQRDLAPIFEILTDPGVTEPLGLTSPAITIEKLRQSKQERIDSNSSSDWTVFLVVEGAEEIIGEIGIAFWDEENHVVEVFLAIHPEYWGHSYGIEALSTLMSWIFSRSTLAVVRAQILERNTRSLRLVSKLGFRESGRRFVHPDPLSNFEGGTSLMLDCREHEFRRFSIPD